MERLERRDCPASVSISGGTTVTEGPTRVTLTVTLSEPLPVPAWVDFATDGSTARHGSDFSLSDGQGRGRIYFAPGVTKASITTRIVVDAQREPTETIKVSLRSPRNCVLAESQATIVILDDDSYSVALSGPAYPVNEGQSATFTVTLSAPATRQEVFGVVLVGQTATLGRDFSRPRVSTVTIPAGAKSATFSVPVVADGLREPDETFLVRVTPPIGTPEPAGVQVTIPSMPLPSIGVQDTSVVEGDSGQSLVKFVVSLSNSFNKPVTVQYATVDATASVVDADYQATSGLITFAPGVTVAEVLVPVMGDLKAESDEQFLFTLAEARNASIVSSVSRCTIIDDDTPKLSVADVSVIEGNEGVSKATFVVTLSGKVSSTVNVSYATADGTATVADGDYVAKSGVLSFTAAQRTRTITIDVTGDLKAEADETFSLLLLSPTNATIARNGGVGTIVNDETDQQGFQITLSFTDPALPDSTKSIFRRAAARWSEIITGDLPNVIENGLFIDDFRFDVTVDSGMSPDVLGGANFYPDGLRGGVRGLPYKGFGVFNARYMSAAGMYYTVLHEMAHALGFSPDLWSSPGFDLVQGWGASGASDPVFTGTNATREFNRIFSKSAMNVPLEDTQGPGSYGSHWRESVFGSAAELMTWSGDPFSSAVSPVSAVTVGAFADLGYQVNYAAADRFTARASVLASAVVQPGSQSRARTIRQIAMLGFARDSR
jgi:hypothetical protein